jgi:hypothetical protein
VRSRQAFALYSVSHLVKRSRSARRGMGVESALSGGAAGDIVRSGN